jgi:hypothetical protein
MIAAGLYRQLARIGAARLYAGGLVESVMLRRSVATGEVRFPRSDIDLLVVLREDAAGDGAKLADLCGRVKTLNRLIPRFSHIDVQEPGGPQRQALTDSYWASLERRVNVPLAGRPVDLPAAPVDAAHAIGKLSLWLEWFIPNSIARRDRRNLWKTALEAWTACTVAEGAIAEPFVTRAEMERAAREHEAGLDPARLSDPAYAARFVFGLAARLHAAHLPPLPPLAHPLVVDIATPPLMLERRFVILPNSDTPLPPEVFRFGAFPCTPESIELYVRFLNPFIYGVLPPELGLRPPTPADYLRAVRYYGHERFLYYPGFAGADAGTQQGHLETLRHALDALEQSRLPEPLPQAEFRALRTPAASWRTYYRDLYPALRRHSLALAERAAAL